MDDRDDTERLHSIGANQFNELDYLSRDPRPLKAKLKEMVDEGHTLGYQSASAQLHHCEKMAKVLGELLIAGNLSKKDFLPFKNFDSIRRNPFMRVLDVRQYVVQVFSWFVFTTEFLDSLAKLVKNKRVVEVAAQYGYLKPLMESRGCKEWISTDIKPRKFWVTPYRATPAVEKFKPDVIFASWIPYGSTLDMWLANTRVPMIMVGEGWGGCTGSGDFWSAACDLDRDDVDCTGKDWTVQQPSNVVDDWTDVSQWWGLRDFTTLVNWKSARTAAHEARRANGY